MVIQPTLQVPAKVRFVTPSEPTRKSARLSVSADSDDQRPNRSSRFRDNICPCCVTLTADEPSSIAEAMRRPDAAKWSAAVNSELDNLVSKGTWEETTLPQGRKAIGCKWVLKTKTDADGNVAKYKARLVAQGFSQQPGIDFE